jgi:azurin
MLIACTLSATVVNKTRRALVACLLAASTPARSLARPPRVALHIASDGDNLAFIPDHLSCAAGAHVRLYLHHRGEIIDDPHDWVLLKPGTQARFLADADRQQNDAVIPPNDNKWVLAATPLCAKGQTVMIEFTAPSPGDYPFVCSVPGHGDSMRGILIVRARP